ncbi:hypothetical protein [Sphingomonas crocodyli]|uniref:Uncharacterized protein n=1 Tax=Sphingomonas crocodyli TaxID=1979270 RepID=A0A437M4Y8_9SPHN|nr:hypothetical protein [Sphingomonas crocodyli]RVT92739.1 hypothetical protein EOD43_02120 [Sphingomonas crocodyli]
MQNRAKFVLSACVAALLTPAVVAAPEPRRPEMFDKLVACRTITDPTQRLACYDAQVVALDTAEKNDDLVIMDRKQVQETRRSLFGFTLPKFSLGGKKLDEKDDTTEIESTVQSVRRAGNGWSFTLANDAGTWETPDGLGTAPKVGDKIRIKKAMMGSYLGSVGFNRGVRFRRVQ